MSFCGDLLKLRWLCFFLDEAWQARFRTPIDFSEEVQTPYYRFRKLGKFNLLFFYNVAVWACKDIAFDEMVYFEQKVFIFLEDELYMDFLKRDLWYLFKDAHKQIRCLVRHDITSFWISIDAELLNLLKVGYWLYELVFLYQEMFPNRRI